MKIHKKTSPELISPSEMQDGDIAVIREHPRQNDVGNIVQRYYSRYIRLGERGCFAYTEAFGESELVKVEILNPGTLLEI